MEQVIGLKEFRGSVRIVERNVNRGRSYIVLRKSKPLFRVAPLNEDGGAWETIADFTRIRRGGIPIRELLSRL